MFKTKKRLYKQLREHAACIARLCATNSKLSKRVYEHKVAEKELREQLADTELSLAAAYKKRDELLAANGELKCEADKQRQENEKLAEMLGLMSCPQDCKGHTVNAPGGSYCRACIRNPHARDKYEAAE